MGDVSPGTTGLDMNGCTSLAALDKRRQGNRELCRRRQKGDDGKQPTAAPWGGWTVHSI